MDRRKFLFSTAIVSAASLINAKGLSIKENSERELIPIIDTHQHLWDIETRGSGWSKPPLPRNFNMHDYLEATKGLNVIKSVYMEVAVPPEKRHEEALYAIEICRNKQNPTVAAVIAVDPNRTDFRQYLEEFRNNPFIKGIRYFFKTAEEINSEIVVRNIQYLGEIGRSFDVVVPPKWLALANQLIKSCPNTRFIIDHCGNADPKAFFKNGKQTPAQPEHDPQIWKNDIRSIAMEKNVICKISGIVSRVPNYELSTEDVAPIINHCLDEFGPDKVMFAGDWPVCLKNMPLANWVNLLKTVVKNRPVAEQKKLFHDNAQKFYHI